MGARNQVCLCLGPRKKKIKNWRVFQQEPVVFGRYHFVVVVCLQCGCRWKTRERYIEQLEKYKSGDMKTIDEYFGEDKG